MSRKRSFTVSREPIELGLGGEDFFAVPVVAPAVLGDMLDAGERISEIQSNKGLTQKQMLDEMLKVLDATFGAVLAPDSKPRFHERLFSPTEPFDLMRELMPALEWLVEEYSDRPTVPSQPSSTGPSGGESSSTSGAPPEGSTPSTSLPTDGATPSTQPSTT